MGALLGGCESPASARRAGPPIPVADAHSHYGLFAPSKIRQGEDLAPRLRDAGVALLAWSVTSDGPWIGPVGPRFEQKSLPRKGEVEANFFGFARRARGWAERAGLRFALAPSDVDRALAGGEPMLVLAAEAADFLEGSLAGLERAYALGLRHTQIVHFLRDNAVGNLQTAPPLHPGGLTAFGEALVRACNRQGILVDLAHCARDTFDRALDVTAVAPIWSHSVIGETDEHFGQPGDLARRLNVSRARRLAARGGAVGLWALAGSTGYRVAAYADSLMHAVDLVGAEHVMIGSDTDGFGRNGRASIESPADLRRVVDALLARRVDERTVRAVCAGNYARCLRGAMARRAA
ncbi:MAG: membrane dipeptidase [Burkholderiaceae bacterium]